MLVRRSKAPKLGSQRDARSACCATASRTRPGLAPSLARALLTTLSSFATRVTSSKLGVRSRPARCSRRASARSMAAVASGANGRPRGGAASPAPRGTIDSTASRACSKSMPNDRSAPDAIPGVRRIPKIEGARGRWTSDSAPPPPPAPLPTHVWIDGRSSRMDCPRRQSTRLICRQNSTCKHVLPQPSSRVAVVRSLTGSCLRPRQPCRAAGTQAPRKSPMGRWPGRM